MFGHKRDHGIESGASKRKLNFQLENENIEMDSSFNFDNKGRSVF
jgi:hypothetical protein